MSKKYIILFLSLVTAFGCSSDDTTTIEQGQEQEEEQEQDDDEVVLRISKLTEIHRENTFIRYYNEDGTVLKELRIFDGGDEDDKPYSLYTYNNQQNLESIKFYSENDEFVRNHRIYEYNSNNQLTKLTDYGDGTHEPYHTNFTYSANRVNFEEAETERSAYIKFDDQGKIVETYHQSGSNFYITNFIKYEGNQVSEISQFNGKKYVFETVDSPNPLFQFFIKKPMQYILTEHYTYDLDFTFDTSYSIHNVVKISESFDNTALGTEETTFQYNENNYPVSSTTMRKDGSMIERTFEYH